MLKSIIKNDAFLMLSKSTGYSEQTLQEIIFKKLQDERMSYFEIEDDGKSLQEIAQSSGYDVPMLVDVLFPKEIDNREVLEIMDSIIVSITK